MTHFEADVCSDSSHRGDCGNAATTASRAGLPHEERDSYGNDGARVGPHTGRGPKCVHSRWLAGCGTHVVRGWSSMLLGMNSGAG